MWGFAKECLTEYDIGYIMPKDKKDLAKLEPTSLKPKGDTGVKMTEKVTNKRTISEMEVLFNEQSWYMHVYMVEHDCTYPHTYWAAEIPFGEKSIIGKHQTCKIKAIKIAVKLANVLRERKEL